MTLAEHNQRCEIIREIKAHLPDCGEVRIEPGLEPRALSSGGVCFSLCWWFYCDNPQTSMSFWTLEELAKFVHRKIHALKLLTVTTPTPEERYRKDCLRRSHGVYDEREMN